MPTLDSSDEARLAELAKTVTQDPTETIVPTDRQVTGLHHAALAELATRRPISGSSFPKQLEMGRTLGEGGMGIVRLATQTILGRGVAVKSPRAEQPGEKELLRLMQEAWVTGRLEHPNIVPIHDIAMDVQGRPHIVLKRISGTEWSKLLKSPEDVRERFGVTDVFDWHLRILTQLCNAVHFAHSLGIVHRDLKPENVMIGEFGEVYLLDWGIAVSLEDDGSGRFPLASEVKGITGTLVYMAPEMLGGEGSEITSRTDVYLLGSVLYEVVCGGAPHAADNPMAIIVRVARSQPTMGPAVPRELAEVIRRAMAREPEDRFESADALRQRIVDFLEHRGATALARDAEARLAELESLVASNADRCDLYNVYGACGFGFRAALDRWESERALAGLHRATGVMADFELRRGDPSAAEALVDQLPERPAELSARIEMALREHAEKQSVQDSLAAIGEGRDLRVGSRARATVLLALGVIWTLGPLVRGLFYDAGELTALESVANGGLIVGAGLLVVATGRLRNLLLATEVNRSMLGALLIVGGTNTLHGLLAWGTGADRIDSVGLMAVVAAVCAMVAVAIERRFWPAALAFFCAMSLIALWPDQRAFWVAGANVVVLLTVAMIWWPKSSRGSAV